MNGNYCGSLTCAACFPSVNERNGTDLENRPNTASSRISTSTTPQPEDVVSANGPGPAPRNIPMKSYPLDFGSQPRAQPIEQLFDDDLQPSAGWEALSDWVRKHDEEKIKEYKEDIDTLLVFVSTTFRCFFSCSNA